MLGMIRRWLSCTFTVDCPRCGGAVTVGISVLDMVTIDSEHPCQLDGEARRIVVERARQAWLEMDAW